MNRTELQQLSRDRILDAKILLAGKRWSAAYYLTGYAVECGLKSCIIRRLMATDEFPEKKFSEQCWTHSLTQLLGLAGLKTDLEKASLADANLLASWEAVKDWTESSRYGRIAKAKAEELYDAVTDKKHGVLSWIQARW